MKKISLVLAFISIFGVGCTPTITTPPVSVPSEKSPLFKYTPSPNYSPYSAQIQIKSSLNNPPILSNIETLQEEKVYEYPQKVDDIKLIFSLLDKQKKMNLLQENSTLGI